MIDWLSRSTFDRLLDDLGPRIAQGRITPGTVLTVDRLVESTGASRSVVREAVRVLGAMGLLTASRRVGLTIAPPASWNGLDPRVIRWRLAGQDREVQRRELLELRRAVEPQAARLAAERHSDAAAAELESHVVELRAATERRDRDGFLAADRALHAGILAASANALFVRLGEIVDEALLDRAPSTPVEWRRAPHDADLHERLVRAITARDPEAARIMELIVDHA